jgi:hypothetical protein
MTSLLIINISPVPYSRDNDRVLVLKEDYAPVTDPKPHTFAPFQTLHKSQEARSTMK